MDITSDLDFDAAHPAGASLADIVILCGTSPYKYIQSNYTDGGKYLDPPFLELVANVGMNSFLWTEDGYHPICKLLTELTAEDLILLHPFFILKFTVVPPPGEHNFTLTFRAADKTLEQVVKVAIP